MFGIEQSAPLDATDSDKWGNEFETTTPLQSQRFK